MKGKSFSFFRYNKFTFGEQVVSQFVLFECKFLFSIILFYFHKTNGTQDRYHTHAFNSLSVKLWGNYNEYILLTKDPQSFNIKKRTKTFKYFSKNVYHKIGKSNGCCTILFSGSWDKTWEEFLNEKTYTYNWNRK
jgi:hypothetical protein